VNRSRSCEHGFPIADDNSDRRITPYVNYALIAINVLVFVVFQQLGTNEAFTYRFATVPEKSSPARTSREPVTIHDPITERTLGQISQATPISVYITLLTSMFMHGGIAHILGNMLFLWIFGDNVEDVLGRSLSSSTSYVVCSPRWRTSSPRNSPAATCSFLPQCLGGDLRRPRRLRAAVPDAARDRDPLSLLTEVPAHVAVGIWFLFQLINGLGNAGRVGVASPTGPTSAGSSPASRWSRCSPWARRWSIDRRVVAPADPEDALHCRRGRFTSRSCRNVESGSP
jgi:membrane associated rhomboid family serine protease